MVLRQLLESCSDQSCVLIEMEYNNHRTERIVNAEKTLAMSDVDKEDKFDGLFAHQLEQASIMR